MSSRIFFIGGILCTFFLKSSQVPVNALTTGADFFAQNSAVVINQVRQNPQLLTAITEHYQQESPTTSTQAIIVLFNRLPLHAKLDILAKAQAGAWKLLPSLASLETAAQRSPIFSYPSPEAAVADYTQKYVALLPANTSPDLTQFKYAVKQFLRGLLYSERIINGMQRYLETVLQQAVVLAQARTIILPLIENLFTQQKAYPDTQYLQITLEQQMPQSLKTPELQTLLTAYRAGAQEAGGQNILESAANRLFAKSANTNPFIALTNYLVSYNLRAMAEELELPKKQ